MDFQKRQERPPPSPVPPPVNCARDDVGMKIKFIDLLIQLISILTRFSVTIYQRYSNLSTLL